MIRKTKIMVVEDHRNVFLFRKHQFERASLFINCWCGTEIIWLARKKTSDNSTGLKGKEEYPCSQRRQRQRKYGELYKTCYSCEHKNAKDKFVRPYSAWVNNNMRQCFPGDTVWKESERKYTVEQNIRKAGIRFVEDSFRCWCRPRSTLVRNKKKTTNIVQALC